MPKSVCGPMRNWPGCRLPDPVSGGYRLMLKRERRVAGERGERVDGCPSASAHSTSSSSADARICARYRSTGARSSGTSAGQTFGGNQTASTAGSPVGVSGADRERLLEVRRGLGAVRAALASTPGREPAASADPGRVALLRPGRQREEPAPRLPYRGPQLRGDAVPGDQQEPGLLQRGVDLRGGTGVGSPGPPGAPGRSSGSRRSSPMSSFHSSRSGGDEVGHQPGAAVVVQQGDLDPVLGQPVVPAAERARLADHHRRRCRTGGPARSSTSTARAWSP